MNKKEWTSALTDYVEEQRRVDPIVDRGSLSEEEEWQCRIIGGEFIGWHDGRLNDILGERLVLRMMNFDPEPLVVLTTNMPGLVALQEILSDSAPENLVYLQHEKLIQWEKLHPVDEFTFHIHHWSYFREIDPELLARARETCAEVNVADFRVHTTGDLWGEQCGVQADHLWRWNGEEMELLEEAFSQMTF